MSFTIESPSGDEYEKAGMRSAAGEFALEAPELLEAVDEFGDNGTIQIVGVFPGFVLQQIKNCLAVRRIVPRGLNETELLWTAFGFADDDDKLTTLRLRQGNVSIDDSEMMASSQQGIAPYPNEQGVLEMGGRDVASNPSRISETSVRGFWQAWRGKMGI